MKTAPAALSIRGQVNQKYLQQLLTEQNYCLLLTQTHIVPFLHCISLQKGLADPGKARGCSTSYGTKPRIDWPTQVLSGEAPLQIVVLFPNCICLKNHIRTRSDSSFALDQPAHPQRLIWKLGCPLLCKMWSYWLIIGQCISRLVRVVRWPIQIIMRTDRISVR